MDSGYDKYSILHKSDTGRYYIWLQNWHSRESFKIELGFPTESEALKITESIAKTDKLVIT